MSNIDESTQTGFYFEFGRGSWVKKPNEPTEQFPLGGLAYVGWITYEQLEGLDKLINDYLAEIPNLTMENPASPNTTASA